MAYRTAATKLSDISTATDAFRDAVARTVFYTDHGTHGDGKLRAAQEAEAEARTALMKAIGSLASLG